MNEDKSEWTTGNWLERYLFEHGIMKKEVCEATGLDDSTLLKMCKGNRKGNLDSWMRVSDALGCTLSELVEPLKLLERFAFLEEPNPPTQEKPEMKIDGVPISDWLKL